MVEIMERLDDVSEHQAPTEGLGPASQTVERLRVATVGLDQAERRLAAAKRINTVLASVTKTSSPDERPAVARAVLQMLDEPAFKAAFDVDGVSCRVSAVNTLLELGYPWALEVHPDDLAFYRQKTQAAPRGRRWLIAGAIALIAAGLGFLALEGRHPPPVRPSPPITAPKHVQAAPIFVPSQTYAAKATIDPLPAPAAAPRAFTRTPSAVIVHFPGSGPGTRIALQYSELPEVESALQALEKQDFTEALEQVNRCAGRYKHAEACQVLKIIAMRMRNTGLDQTRAINELRLLGARDPGNASLPGLSRMISDESPF